MRGSDLYVLLDRKKEMQHMIGFIRASFLMNVGMNDLELPKVMNTLFHRIPVTTEEINSLIHRLQVTPEEM